MNSYFGIFSNLQMKSKFEEKHNFFSTRELAYIFQTIMKKSQFYWLVI